MKKLFVLTLALFTFLTLGAFAQDQTATSKKSTKKSSTMSSESTMKAKSSKLTGTIGSDGKTFTNDADQSSWTISNPDKVKGHEGHHVILRGKTDESAKSVDVTSVTMATASGKSGKKGKKAASAPPTGK